MIKYNDIELICKIYKSCKVFDCNKYKVIIEDNYLNKDQIEVLLKDIEYCFKIIKLELKKSYNDYLYKKKIPTLFFHGEKVVSHLVDGYDTSSKRVPYVILSYYGIGNCPLLHELTHFIMGNASSLMIREGLAGYMEIKYGKNNCYPNFGKEVNSLLLEYNESYNDMYNILVKENLQNRKLFYLLSYSFCTWLIESFGLEKFLKIYYLDIVSCSESVYNTSFKELFDNWITTTLN